MRRSSAPLLVLLLAGCSPGFGRAPTFADATVDPDAGFFDALVFPDASPWDSGVRDGTIALPDAAPRASYDFTGIFGILNSTSVLYARQVGARLNLVVDDFPYVYVGTISAEGVVDTESPALVAQGCRIAKITGTYDRDAATYQLHHQTCNTSGQSLGSDIRGGFADDFVHAYSGVFELQATVNDPNNCYFGPRTGLTVHYAFGFLGSGVMEVFTADDIIETPEWYRGQASGDGTFSALDPASNVQMRGQFAQATASDPLRFTGLRDVWDPAKGCGFTITLDGVRVVTP